MTAEADGARRRLEEVRNSRVRRLLKGDDPLSVEDVRLVTQRNRTAWPTAPKRYEVRALALLEALAEEVANLSTEGLLKMGNHPTSGLRYHAHGEVLWPVGPDGMCAGCST